MSFEKELEAAAQEYAGCVSLADLGIEDGSFAEPLTYRRRGMRKEKKSSDRF
jgi:hypothetical protein